MQPGPQQAQAAPAEPPTAPWAQQPAEPQSRATERARRLVSGLPPWEPLPPGEILVRRHHRQS
ncbi:MAG TPA: hypothetical protein VL738_02955 [Dactylosporangium sp.]|jgi:hypothetical protein|nr:hypothetical protein [Dactylosporangium sp.]